MADLRALHSMLIEMHSGMLTLATFCIFAVILYRLHQRTLKNDQQQASTRASQGLTALLEKIAKYAEPTSYMAGLGGFIGLVISSIVGYYAWPANVLLSFPLTQNKIMMAVLSTEFWAIFVLIRTLYGKNLWTYIRLSIVSACAGFAGFFFMVLTGSLGGHMIGVHVPGRGSVLDPIYDLLGINPNVAWIGLVPFLGLVVSIIVGFALLFRFYVKQSHRNL